MEVSSRVFWKDGAFLSPQHFQQLQRNLEATFQPTLRTREHLEYGLLDLTIDEGALKMGRFVILQCRAILPDATLIHIPQIDPPPRPLLFSAADVEAGFEVLLSLPALSPHRASVSPNAERGDVRYHAKEMEISDDAAPDQKETIDVAHLNLRLSLNAKPDAHCVTLPIAKIERSVDGLPSLSPQYIPPCLNVHASPVLLSLIQRLTGTIQARARARAEVLRHETDVEALGITSMPGFWYLHTLNQHAMILQHFIDTAGVHPETLYLELLRLSSALASFELKAADYSGHYQQHLLTQSFGQLYGHLIAQLGRLFVSRYEHMPFEKKENLWTVSIGDEIWYRPCRFYLMITGTLPPVDTIARIPGACKLASVEQIGALIRSATEGIQMQLVLRPPPPIPLHRSALYFTLESTGPTWEEVKRVKQLALSVPDWMSKLSYQLIALFSPDKGTPHDAPPMDAVELTMAERDYLRR